MKLSIPRRTMETLRGAKADVRVIQADDVTVYLHLLCPTTGVHYFVFGMVEANGKVSLIGHVFGGRYTHLHTFITNSLDEVVEGDFFGGEIPTIDPDHQPRTWKRMRRDYRL